MKSRWLVYAAVCLLDGTGCLFFGWRFGVGAAAGVLTMCAWVWLWRTFA